MYIVISIENLISLSGESVMNSMVVKKKNVEK